MKNNYLISEKAFLKQIGINIKQQRKKEDISQESLALKCEIDRAYMGRVERGEINISVLKLKKIADVLNIQTSDLLKKNGK
jgi:transcriptional regulator with XRE-family HTH domain